MNRRNFILKSGTVASALAGIVACAERKAEQPNILWIIAEDMCPDLGCYGHDLTETPNIDRLAREGTRFTHAFSTSSLCSPSRSSFITGMYATSIGAHHQMITKPAYSGKYTHVKNVPNNDVWLPAPVEPMTWIMQRAGYFTANIADQRLGSRSKHHYNFNRKRSVWESNKWSDLTSRQPFYGQVNFYLTHRIPIYQIQGPETPRFSAPQKIDPAQVKLPPYYPDHPVIRADWAGYLDAVCQVDKLVGDVIDQLKRDGLWENTIVFFFSDHGRPMPRQKHWLYDSGLKVPLIVRVPEKWQNRFGVQSGAVDDRLVSLIDLTVTSLDMAGITKPAWMQGRVLFGPNRESDRDYVIGARDNAGTAIMRNRTVRTRRYRYIRNFTPDVAYKDVVRPANELIHPHWLYLRLLREQGKLTPEQAIILADRLPEEELYDLEKDPYEIHNLAGNPRYTEQLDQMRKTLEKWIQSSGDRGDEPTDPEMINGSYQYEQNLRELYNQAYYKPLKKRGLPVLPFDDIAVGAEQLR